MIVTASVSASALKARCLGILHRLAPNELERVVVGRLKRTAARRTRPNRHEDAVRNIHGFMRGSIIVAEDADLTAPLLEPEFAADDDPHG